MNEDNDTVYIHILTAKVVRVAIAIAYFNYYKAAAVLIKRFTAPMVGINHNKTFGLQQIDSSKFFFPTPKKLRKVCTISMPTHCSEILDLFSFGRLKATFWGLVYEILYLIAY